MGEDADITISIQLANGLKTLPQNIKLLKDGRPFILAETASKKLEFELPANGGDKTIAFNGLGGNDDKLLFVAISADRTTYKDSCGKEHNGIVYFPTGSTGKCEVLDKPHVYIARNLQPLDEFTKGLTFSVCKDMLLCSTEADKKRVAISVTYGIGKLASALTTKPAKGERPEEKVCVPCAAAAVN
jgi:hypothetical protein